MAHQTHYNNSFKLIDVDLILLNNNVCLHN